MFRTVSRPSGAQRVGEAGLGVDAPQTLSWFLCRSGICTESRCSSAPLKNLKILTVLTGLCRLRNRGGPLGLTAHHRDPSQDAVAGRRAAIGCRGAAVCGWPRLRRRSFLSGGIVRLSGA